MTRLADGMECFGDRIGPRAAGHAARSRAARHGFSFVEMLVVIGIIIALLGLLGAAIVAGERSAKKQAISACLGNISQAIESYYVDFNIYPVSDPAIADTPNCGYKIGAAAAVVTTGASGLAQALLGYLDYAYDGAGPSNGDPMYGFRMTPGGHGRIYGPYMTASSTIVGSNTTTTPPSYYFIDPLGQTILYYRANPSITITAGSTAYFAVAGIFNDADNSAYLGALQNYSSSACTGPADATAGHTSFAFRQLLGSASGSNTVAASDAPLNTRTYLLVSPGPDGNYFDGNNIVNK